ncbi:hypothetical protein BATDEDRAFT_26718 [Batrachochytrium dendrobatidis JAM81]|uniref:RING-type domain-containing protein n=1 Tax=Batrachochytrium dendrobatidis (strain JAM81 / FGSC 10211) TaxID=684364 RepID=F4P896_BATDJ|nr:uncharacterized protein BATDEDRAFT_26718 [Batrachochytrium dendrobatidis JAM81]EGF78768.1 hypothetical protein BATDEDRAFT_26718 [Batrachochytrium dendrobatidis JAM81]|eukprot:XP_006680743.1 hypothetical protein BATDEDRAFT_26718 [Batrachochytrium dendrobatidis JAM81]
MNKPTQPFSSHRPIGYKSPIYAAAIQDHLSRLHLVSGHASSVSFLPPIPGISTKRVKPKYTLNTRQRQLEKWHKDAKRIQHDPNLSQPISKKDKLLVEENGFDRVLDAPQKPFTLGSILLSCSHIFHKSCLESYERHVQMKCCPLCRDTTYQKMLTAEGRRACRRISAIKIQKTWRMWKCRKAYLEYQQHHPPKHPKLLKTYHLNKIQLSTLDWDQVYIKACQLETDCCAICIMPLNPTKTSDTASKQIPKKRHRLGLLSCAHMFHWVCLERLERFDIDRKVHVCPVCRRHYEKLEIQMDSKQETLI